MWAQIGEPPPFDGVEWIERHLTSSGEDAGREDYARLQAEGRTLTFDAAIVEAVKALQRSQWPSAQSWPSRGREGQNLSTKPSEVLVKSTFPGDWAIGTPRISRSSNVWK